MNYIFRTILLICFVNSLNPDLGLNTKLQEPQTFETALHISRSKVVVGESMTWFLSLTPIDRQPIESIKIFSGDEAIWALPNPPTIENQITQTVTIVFQAIPLVEGILTPVVKICYISNGESTLVVLSEIQVKVISVNSLVISDLQMIQPNIRENKSLGFDVWIQNNSPFTLTQIMIQATGVDLETQLFQTIENSTIPPHTTMRFPISMKVNGLRPQPNIHIKYVWKDDNQYRHQENSLVHGNLFEIDNRLIKGVANELVGIFLGVVVGTVTTLGVNIIQQIRSDRKQQKANKRQMFSLLKLATFQSKLAAHNGTLADMDPLIAVFREEELYTSMLEYPMVTEYAQVLWQAAQRYNSSFTLSGGALRSDELDDAASKLEEGLKVVF